MPNVLDKSTLQAYLNEGVHGAQCFCTTCAHLRQMAGEILQSRQYLGELHTELERAEDTLEVWKSEFTDTARSRADLIVYLMSAQTVLQAASEVSTAPSALLRENALIALKESLQAFNTFLDSRPVPDIVKFCLKLK